MGWQRRVICVLLCALLTGCTPTTNAPLVAIDGSTMGTTYHIKIVPNIGKPSSATALREGIEAVLVEIDRQMSTYRADSEISRFNNHRGTDWVSVSEDFAAIVALSKKISLETGGAFDITVGPLVDLWGFGPAGGAVVRIPTREQIQRTLTHVGQRYLSVRTTPPALRKSVSDIRVDLNAIAPGFAVDKIARYLARLGISDYLIELGGEVYAAGTRQDGSAWHVGIERADRDGSEVGKVVQLRDKGLSTSGSYRNFINVSGERYSHEIDPRTGRASHHRTAAVTVIAASAAEADGYSTALLVMGSEAGIPFAVNQGISAVFQIIQDDGSLDTRSTGNPFQ